MQPKVSIIIPVYNVEKYLRKCLDSCINQTLKELEIIVVNDCSPDNSDEIMQEYEIRYPDLIKCIYLKENIKLGGARNRGIEIAQGKYIMFVDSDDYIAEDMCEKLYNSIISNDADIVICDCYHVINDGEKYLAAFNPEAHSKDNIQKQLFFNNSVQISAWGKLYKKELLGTCLFPEHLYYEDLATVLIWLLKAEKINYIAEPLYYYLYRNNSITNVYEYSNKIQEVTALIKLIENLKNENLFDINNYDIKKHILKLVYSFIIRYMCCFLTCNHEKLDLLRECIRENIPNYEEIIDKYCLLMESEKYVLVKFLNDSNFFENLRKNSEKFFTARENFALWGTGVWGKNIYSFINQFGVKPVCFIDSNIEQQGKYIDGIEITSLEKLNDTCDMIVVAIKDKKVFDEIKGIVKQSKRNIDVIHYIDLFKVK